jgi:hypothetical protein
VARLGECFSCSLTARGQRAERVSRERRMQVCIYVCIYVYVYVRRNAIVL